jgi:glucose/arabinose dehydrogenase
MVRGASPRRTALAVFAGGLALLLSAFLVRAGRAGDDDAQSLQQAAAPAIALQQLASGLGSVTSITNAGDARLFLTTQAGQIRIYSAGTVLATPFLDVSSLVFCCGERGLLSVAFHPQYASNGFFFIYYTNLAGDIEIVRYQRSASNPNLADASTRAVLLPIPHPTNSNHNGGQLQFGPDGYLYIGTGDGGGGNDVPCNAQNDNSPLGKLLRIDVDQNVSTPPFYGIPPSNPQATGALPRNLTWAKGLRNPWRFSFDRSTGDLWIGDVGQGAWEEIDFQPGASAGGENYGWKIMEGNHCGGGGSTNCPTSPAPPPCFSPLFTYPVYEYDHSLGCSVNGGYVYRGAQDATLSGVYIYGDFCSGRIWGNGELFAPTVSSLQTFGEDVTGELYVGTGTGLLYLITHPGPPTPTPTSAPPTSTPTPTATPTATSPSPGTPTPVPADSRPSILRSSGPRPPPRVLTPR